MSMMPPQYPCPACGAEAGHELPRFINTTPKWQPIDTAPKNGRTVMLSLSGLAIPVIAVGRFCVDGGDHGKYSWRISWNHNDIIERGFAPTHWMPLPNPPEAEI